MPTIHKEEDGPASKCKITENAIKGAQTGATYQGHHTRCSSPPLKYPPFCWAASPLRGGGGGHKVTVPHLGGGGGTAPQMCARVSQCK